MSTASLRVDACASALLQQHGIAAVSTAMSVEHPVLSTGRSDKGLAGDARLLSIVQRQISVE